MDLNKVINDTVKEIPPSGIRKFFDLATELSLIHICRNNNKRKFVTRH